MPQWPRAARPRGDSRRAEPQRSGSCAAPRPRSHEELRRQHGPGRRRPRPARWPGARPGRRERCRQVDADEDPRGRAHRRPRHRRARRQRGQLPPPAPGPGRGHLHGVPGVQPAPGTHRRREHLARTRTTALGVCRRRPDAARHPGPPRRPRRHWPPPPAAGAQPLRRRAADRGDRQGGQLRCADHLHGRADGSAGRPRGRVALLDHPRPDRARCRHPLRVPPAQGDLRPLRHDHRAQGRSPRRDPARCRGRRRASSCG